MTAADEAGTPVAIRRLINRKILASYRQRIAVARHLGMSESEISALAHLAEGGLTPGDLGRRLQVTSGGMTSLLQRLDRRGHITRRPHPTDRRSVIVTAKREVLEQIGDRYAQLIEETDALTADFTGREREAIHRYLALVVACSERHAERLVLDVDAAEVLPDDDALHLWA